MSPLCLLHLQLVLFFGKGRVMGVLPNVEEARTAMPKPAARTRVTPNSKYGLCHKQLSHKPPQVEFQSGVVCACAGESEHDSSVATHVLRNWTTRRGYYECVRVGKHEARLQPDLYQAIFADSIISSVCCISGRGCHRHIYSVPPSEEQG